MFTPKILEAHPLDCYKIWLKFNDGMAGEVDLSHLAGQVVFAIWNNFENFKKVSIENGRSLAWSDNIYLDAVSLYMKYAGKKPEDIFPPSRKNPPKPETCSFSVFFSACISTIIIRRISTLFMATMKRGSTLTPSRLFSGSLPSSAFVLVQVSPLSCK